MGGLCILESQLRNVQKQIYNGIIIAKPHNAYPRLVLVYFEAIVFMELIQVLTRQHRFQRYIVRAVVIIALLYGCYFVQT